jgi:hypothetical protein
MGTRGIGLAIGEGLTLEPVIEDPNAARSTGADAPELAVVSLDGTRSVSVERTEHAGKQGPRWALVERELKASGSW